MSDIIKESLNKDQPIPVSLEGTRIILYQMENCICKIHKDNGAIGTGFFCKIPFNNYLLKVLITNNHILDENEIENNKIINISILNKEKEEEIKKIKIDNTRKKYTNKELDVTIIEIKENKDEIYNFMEIDKEDIKKNKDLIKINYKRKSVYILHYPKGELSVSYGLINDIIDGKINHYCNTEEGSSGSPILSLENNKIIGIHYGGSGIKINYGIFIKNVIDKFNNFYINENKNEINLINNKENEEKDEDNKANLNNRNMIRNKKNVDSNYSDPMNIEGNHIDSKIVKDNDIKFLLNRIRKIHPKINNIYFNLVYRATEDDDKSVDFHKKCDKIGPNITLVKTKKGFIFGGFTFKNWEHLPRDIDINKPNLGSSSRDSRAFGFSVSNQKIYNNEKPNEYAIWCNRKFGPLLKIIYFKYLILALRKEDIVV